MDPELRQQHQGMRNMAWQREFAISFFLFFEIFVCLFWVGCLYRDVLFYFLLLVGFL